MLCWKAWATNLKKELSQSQEKLFNIKKQTIDDYYNGFIEYIKGKKK